MFDNILTNKYLLGLSKKISIRNLRNSERFSFCIICWNFVKQFRELSQTCKKIDGIPTYLIFWLVFFFENKQILIRNLWWNFDRVFRIINWKFVNIFYIKICWKVCRKTTIFLVVIIGKNLKHNILYKRPYRTLWEITKWLSIYFFLIFFWVKLRIWLCFITFL